MIALPRGRAPDPRSLVLDAAAALRHAEGLGHRDPVLLAVHPIARVNPYQQLLYGHAWREGVAPVPLIDLADLDLLESVAAGAGAPFVLHLHWTNKILEGAATEAEARRALATFLGRLDRLVERGGHVVWTVHNSLPHDARRPGLELELQQGIVDRATVVHVLSANTPASVEGSFTIPAAKVVHVPHPSYAGAYQDTVGRDQARWELGLDPDETVYAMLGAIKPYKGTDRLLSAFDAITHRRPDRRRLVVAGLPDKAGAANAFLERCEAHPFVLVHPARIAADEMQLFLRAADLVVLPYVRALNSGVLLLALTFGIPVVAPAVGGLMETITPDTGRLFDPDDDGSLLRALEDADELRSPAARAAARAVAERYDPPTLSARFAAAIRERVQGRGGVA